MINQNLIEQIDIIDKKYSKKNGKVRAIEFGKIISDELLLEEYIINKKPSPKISVELGVTGPYIAKRLQRLGILRNKTECHQNEFNSQWKGDEITYSPLHEWVKRHKPKPRVCENCKKVSPYDLANISQEYHRDIDDFKWLCRKCHMEEDGRKTKLIDRIITQNKDPNFIKTKIRSNKYIKKHGKYN